MRVALLHPSYWPEVRRGSERLVHDAAAGLAARGHDVTLVTSHPGRRSIGFEDGFRVVRNRRPPSRRLNRRSHEHYLSNAPAAAWAAMRGDYDVIHAFFTVDAWAAAWARRHGGPPFVFSFHGIPTRRFLVARRERLPLLQKATESASAATVLSEVAAADYRRYLLRRPEVLPGGVFCSRFDVDVPRAREPTLVCAASLNDPRKRAPLLLRAFARLRERYPSARLLLAGRTDPAQPAQRLDLPQGAEWIDGDRTDVLARAYASSWASVMPAVEEAFGLTLVESLAAGTPAVAARSGGCPDILSDENVGRLFTPDDEDDLLRALGEALELGSAGAGAACRMRAREYDWSAILPRYERLYAAALRERDPGTDPHVAGDLH